MPDDMFTFNAALAQPLLDYCLERLKMQPVELDYGGTSVAFEDRLHGLLNEEGSDPAAVFSTFTDVLAPRVVSADSERFLAFIPAAPTKAALLFDMVVSASSLHAASWLESAGAVAAENQVLTLLAEMAGLPSGSGGAFVGGGSIGNLSALAVARDVGRRRLGTTGTVKIALSEEAHSSNAGALRLLDVEPLLIPAVDHRLTGAALAAALEAEPDRSLVVGVVGTAGTTNAGIIDDLRGIGEVAKARNAWFHVDGAYGLAGLFSPSLHPKFDGLELADSFIVDPHKWLFAPFDSCALVYAQPALARSVHTQHASYLDILHDDANIEWNPSDYAVHLSRRPKGLPIWFSLAVHGTRRYGEAVDQAIKITNAAVDQINAAPHVRMLRAPELSIVLFERIGWTTADYERWSEQLVRDQIAFVTPTSWEGKTCARFAFLNPHTTEELVAQILETCV